MPINTFHLRSSVQGQEPTAGTAQGQLPVGSIAINFNAAEPFLTIQDSSGAIRRIAGVKIDATGPLNPTAGEWWVDTSGPTKIVKVFDGTAWVATGSPVVDATTTTKGIAQLADAAAVATGTPGRVVTADQLKATNDAVATATSGGISTINGTSPVSVTGTGGTRTVAVADATVSDKGVVQLADAAAIAAGAPGRIVDAAQLKANVPADATETTKGIAEIATQAEVNAGTDATRIVTPARLKAYVTEQLKATWLPAGGLDASDIGTSTWNGPIDTLTATGSVEERVATGPWGATAAVTPAEQVQVRWKSADIAAAAHGATVTGRVANADGSVAVDYSTTVDKLPNPITISPQSAVAASAAVDSAASTAVGGINAPARLWLRSTNGTAEKVNIGGSGWVAIPSTPATGLAITAGQTFQLRHTTQAGANTVTTTEVYVGWDATSSVVASYATTNAAVPPLAQATATTIAGLAEVGATLTATPGTASGGTPAITYATRWQSSADGTSSWADIASASGVSYVIKGTDLNKYLRAVTTATDATTPTAQTLELPSLSSAKVTAPVVATFGWNADTDVYTRDSAADRIIDVHVRVRRCLLTNGGVASYLDADNSTKLAGDWLRLVETTELNTPYTGTHGAEVANTALRAAVTAWSAGTYTKGQRVTHNGSVWECLAATTTATPAAGTANATLDGSSAQVMVEIPRFSVKHETAAAGTHQQHTFHLTHGTKVDDGYAVHPAFIKPDASYRDFIYIGAYLGTGTNGNGSASGVNNATNFTRAASRTACAGRGAGWHQLGYWEFNAVQWLLITEYQDMNSQQALGNGASAPGTFSVPTGVSNGRGNRCFNAHTPTNASDTDYVSYRGMENIYGRTWQWLDGINANTYDVYLCANPSQWADDTSTNYTAGGTLPGPTGNQFIRDVMSGISLLASSVAGASGTTFTGDNQSTDVNWTVADAGGSASNFAQCGILSIRVAVTSSRASGNVSARLVYAA